MYKKSEGAATFARPRRFRRAQPSFGNIHILKPTHGPAQSSPPFTPVSPLTPRELESQDVRVLACPAPRVVPRRFDFGITKNRVEPVQQPDGSWSQPLLDKSIIWRIYESAPPTGKFNFINTELQAHGLHTIPDYKNGRILIDDKTTDRDSGYTQFIGSILLVTDEHIEIVSTMQPVTMVTNRILPSVAKQWSQFDLICAEDGATIGLYWFNGAWVIRTINSFDASNLIWNDRATFGQMVNDVMLKYPQFKYDALDKTKSYTLSIKHPAIHAYHEMLDYPVLRAWFIQCTDIAKINRQCGVFNGTISFDESIGLELQLPATAKTLSSMSDISLSRDPKYNNHLTDERHMGMSLADVLDTTRGALGSVMANSSNSAARYFGIILRNKKMTYFIPSDLYEYIASTCYTREISEMLSDEKFNRYKFIILFNALCPENDRDIFMRIYPAWAPAIGRIREFLSKSFASTMFDIYSHLTNGSKSPDVSSSTLDLARSIVINYSRTHGPPENERVKATKMYAEYVMQKQHARVLYDLVYSEINVEVNDHKAE